MTIGNNTPPQLVISSMTITGTNATDFSFTDHGCSGQNCAPNPNTIVRPIQEPAAGMNPEEKLVVFDIVLLHG